MSTEPRTSSTHSPTRHRRLGLVLLGGLLAASIAIPVMAQQREQNEAGEGRRQMLEEFDSDSDGAVSNVEFTARTQERFVELDADNDGQVTTQELAAHFEGEQLPLRALRRFNGADSNSDGTVTQAEFEAATTALFERMDGDTNGIVTPEEARDAMQAMRDEARQRRQEHAGQHAGLGDEPRRNRTAPPSEAAEPTP